MSAIADHHRGGKGEPLLLIHGVTATWRTWGPVIPLLEQQFDVFAPTLPGHADGPSIPEEGDPVAGMADGLEAMLDEIGWDEPHIAGFSLGGQLAFELAKRGRAKSVVAIAPAGAHGDELAREIKRIGRLFRRSHGAAVRFGALAERLSRSPAFRRVSLRDMMVDGSRVPASDSAAMVQAFGSTPIFRYFFEEAGGGRLGLRDLDQVRVPTTVLWGDKDRVLPQGKHEAFFRAGLPAGTEFRTLKQAGHVPFWDAPERIADAIAQAALRADRRREAALR